MVLQQRLLPSGQSYNVLKTEAGTYASKAVLPNNPKLHAHIDRVLELCKPSNVYVVDGSAAEIEFLKQTMLAQGKLIRLNPETYPDCYLYRSSKSDTARVVERTVIACEDPNYAGANNIYKDPATMHAMLEEYSANGMVGQTMYVLPAALLPAGAPIQSNGVMVTSSPYVVLSVLAMYTSGAEALQQIGDEGNFIPGINVPSDLNFDKCWVGHFTDAGELLVWSTHSEYGGNAILFKKCIGLRLGGIQGIQEQSFLAEHMLILKLTDPEGKQIVVCGAFPSACGKTNMAMLDLPQPMKDAGWKAECVSDDITYMDIREDGLYAYPIERGYFGVVPGTNADTNRHFLKAMQTNTVYTNVALDLDTNEPWWEDSGRPLPKNCVDWQGESFTQADADAGKKAAHPNSRATVPAVNNAVLAPDWLRKDGFKVDVVLFGGRRSDGQATPLLTVADDWNAGVFLGATLMSEQTAAVKGQVGKLNVDPYANKDFTALNVAEFLKFRYAVGQRLNEAPIMARINDFARPDGTPKGPFLWPGFGWKIAHIVYALKFKRGEVTGQRSPLGVLPTIDEFKSLLRELGMSEVQLAGINLEAMLHQDLDKLVADLEGPIAAYYAPFESQLPQEFVSRREAVLAAAKRSKDQQ